MWRFGGSSRSWIRSHGRTIPVSLVNVRDAVTVGGGCTMTVRFRLYAGLTTAALLLLPACRSVPPAQAPKDQKQASSQGRIHAGDFLASPKNCGMIYYVRPVYPKEAKKAHIQGVVKCRVLITKAGGVGEVNFISGDPVLVPAAIKAVKQWRYAPCRLEGEPVEVRTQIDVSFTLNQ